MGAELNHTIIHCRDKMRSSAFLTEILGLPPAKAVSHFMVVELRNGVSLDYMETNGPVASQHYAFLIDEADFDPIFARIRAREIAWWADPGRTRPGEINQRDGRRGFYFDDPDGHFLEVLTRPQG